MSVQIMIELESKVHGWRRLHGARSDDSRPGGMGNSHPVLSAMILFLIVVTNSFASVSDSCNQLRSSTDSLTSGLVIREFSKSSPSASSPS
ncbi:unnamed protein product [Gongylonema pulchrum]|uniref:Secreted protein n=1 Tax=Gongylonema pulchrum TaxID=637853 RepID=A0A183D7F5_9BILA|nr:unnamed protein product [Gongylonema pulchrum]